MSITTTCCETTTVPDELRTEWRAVNDAYIIDAP